MAGLTKVPALKMTEHQYELLKKVSLKHKTGSQEVKRLKILLKGAEGQSNYSISKDLGITVKTVELWRCRWMSSYDKLCVYERGESGEGVSDLRLTQEMLKRVKDRPRSGKPSYITLSQKQQIVTLACQKPMEYGIPINNWSLAQLAEVAIREKIVETISPGYVGEILKKSGDTSA